MKKSDNWCYAYFPYGIAFGMFSVLVPLYLVESLGGNLLDLGVMTATATLLGIPASILFGQLPDRFGRTKPFILAAFLSLSLLFFLLSEARSILVFQILYVLLTITDSLHPPSTSVLIAESYHKKSWGTAFSKYNFVVGFAQALGLAFCSLFIRDIGYQTMLWIGGPLALASFLLALIVVEEPPIYVERWISRLERPINEVSNLSYQLGAQSHYPTDSQRRLRMEQSPRMFQVGFGFMMFSLAATCAFTSLPVYLTRKAFMSPSVVFTVFLVRSVVGTLSYVVVGRWISGHNGEAAVKAAAGLRVFLVLLLSTIPLASVSLSPFVAAIILSSVAFSWSLFSVGKNVMIMEYASEGTIGTYDALDGLGSMVGGLLGGAIPAMYGFDMLFVIGSVLFAFTFLVFIKGLKH